MLTLFKQKQQERKLNIVEKLLREDKKRGGLTKEISQPVKTSSVKKKKVKRGSVTAPSSSSMLAERPPAVEGSGQDVGVISVQDSSESASDNEELPIRTLTHKHVFTIVEPEIKGLWDKTAPTGVIGGGVTELLAGSVAGTSRKGAGDADVSTLDGETARDMKKREASKAQIMIMKKAMEKLKRSKISKQVAAGKEFKVSTYTFHSYTMIYDCSILQGQAFSCKPAAVVFRNFDVGKVYSKKVRLTNVSYTVNRCLLEGVSNSIADFVNVEFSPPGSMSAGMTCTMSVTFSPQVCKLSVISCVISLHCLVVLLSNLYKSSHSNVFCLGE